MLSVIVLLLAGAFSGSFLLQRYAKRNLELEQALERNNFLFREKHHRVKNNLQAVSSLVRLQPIPKEAREDMDRRIAAMVAVHEQIYRTDQFDRLDVAPYAEHLIREIAASYPGEVDIDLQLNHVEVDRDHALPLGMIINEVVSNSFKYTFRERARVF